jgi:glycosyltransferase involved in cell wall biosynthesis
MKFGAAILCANEWRFMPAVLGQLTAVCDRILVLRNRRSLSGLRVRLDGYSPLEPRVEVTEDEWSDEAAARNAGMEILADCDYVFIIDSDEILSTDALKLLRDVCTKSQPRAIAARFFTYWKTIDYRIDPPETKPLEASAPVVVRKDVRFTKHRIINNGDVLIPPVFMVHHLSYVRTDEEMRDKLLLFGHADEVVPGWFNDVWKRWDVNPNIENLHPTRPEAFKRAVRVSSANLDAVMRKWGCR